MFCGSVLGIPSEIISPKKVAELHPLLNVHDLVGAMHVPEDAAVSSADVALALASAASQNGKHALGLGRKRPSKKASLSRAGTPTNFHIGTLAPGS